MAGVVKRPARAAAIVGLLNTVLAAALAAAAGAGAAPTVRTAGGGATLTGSFVVKLRIVQPAADRKVSYSFGWGFTPGCATGACSVRVSTFAQACPAGQCAQPSSVFSYAEEPLVYAHGVYRGSFVVKTGCTAPDNSYLPYAYAQRTILVLHPTGSRKVSPAGSKVTAIAGSLELHGVPAAGSVKLGCRAYDYTLSVYGTSPD